MTQTTTFAQTEHQIAVPTDIYEKQKYKLQQAHLIVLSKTILSKFKSGTDYALTVFSIPCSTLNLNKKAASASIQFPSYWSEHSTQLTFSNKAKTSFTPSPTHSLPQENFTLSFRLDYFGFQHPPPPPPFIQQVFFLTKSRHCWVKTPNFHPPHMSTRLQGQQMLSPPSSHSK